MTTIPYSTLDLLKIIKKDYPNKMKLDPEEVGTPGYWKYAGVVELVELIEALIEKQGVKNV